MVSEINTEPRLFVLREAADFGAQPQCPGGEA